MSSDGSSNDKKKAAAAHTIQASSRHGNNFIDTSYFEENDSCMSIEDSVDDECDSHECVGDVLLNVYADTDSDGSGHVSVSESPSNSESYTFLDYVVPSNSRYDQKNDTNNNEVEVDEIQKENESIEISCSNSDEKNECSSSSRSSSRSSSSKQKRSLANSNTNSLTDSNTKVVRRKSILLPSRYSSISEPDMRKVGVTTTVSTPNKNKVSFGHSNSSKKLCRRKSIVFNEKGLEKVFEIPPKEETWPYGSLRGECEPRHFEEFQTLYEYEVNSSDDQDNYPEFVDSESDDSDMEIEIDFVSCDTSANNNNDDSNLVNHSSNNNSSANTVLPKSSIFSNNGTSNNSNNNNNTNNGSSIQNNGNNKNNVIVAASQNSANSISSDERNVRDKLGKCYKLKGGQIVKITAISEKFMHGKIYMEYQALQKQLLQQKEKLLLSSAGQCLIEQLNTLDIDPTEYIETDQYSKIESSMIICEVTMSSVYDALDEARQSKKKKVKKTQQQQQQQQHQRHYYIRSLSTSIKEEKGQKN